MKRGKSQAAPAPRRHRVACSPELPVLLVALEAGQAHRRPTTTPGLWCPSPPRTEPSSFQESPQRPVWLLHVLTNAATGLQACTAASSPSTSSALAVLTAETVSFHLLQLVKHGGAFPRVPVHEFSQLLPHAFISQHTRVESPAPRSRLPIYSPVAPQQDYHKPPT